MTVRKIRTEVSFPLSFLKWGGGVQLYLNSTMEVYIGEHCNALGPA